MDILLSHGYFMAEDPHEQAIMKPYPPLGIMYVSSHLKASGFSVDLVDTTFSTLDAFAAHVRQTRPGIVGLYCNLMTKGNVLRQIGLCKEVGSWVVLGGPEPVNYAEAYLEAGADIVVSGEGELTLEELIPHLTAHGGQALESVDGIIFSDENGRIVRTPAREQLKDLSAQPWPDREAVDIERYLGAWQGRHGYGSVSLITSRGCPYTCKWCSHSVFGFSHRRRRPEEVVKEVAWIRDRYEPDRLWYADDVMTIHPRWFGQYAAQLKERGLNIPFECISRADRLNPQTADTLAEMGCYRLWIGAESGSQRILDAMSRKANVEDIRHKTRLLQERGIQVGMFIMLGYDGETWADLDETTAHLKAANPDVFLTTVAYPIKGTAYYDQVADRVLANGEWALRTDRDLGVAGRHSGRFYGHTTRWMVNEVNLHKARQSGSSNYVNQAKMLANRLRGRLGMIMTRGQREGDGQGDVAGRGWPAEDRATEGW